jgi:divalent metal cation (Fe/Co/Zn/Cd) transporter
VRRIVRDLIGEEPRELRLLQTEDGLLVFLTLALDRDTPLAAAHERASRVEARLREAWPGIAEVIVHTEP